VAQNSSGRRSAIDGRTTRHIGFAISQCIRKRVDVMYERLPELKGLGRPVHGPLIDRVAQYLE